MCCKCARWAVPAWLDGTRRERGEKQMKYVFIVNPVSGHKDKEAIFNRIRSAFRLLDDEMIVASIKRLLQSNIRCGLQNYKQYSLTYNLQQLVFQVDIN